MNDEIEWAKIRERAAAAVRSYVSPPATPEEQCFLDLLTTAYQKGYRAGHADGFAAATRKESGNVS